MLEQVRKMPFYENISFITSDEFLEFLSLPSKVNQWRNLSDEEIRLLTLYNNILNLIESAMKSDTDFNKLIDLYHYYKRKLTTKY